MTDKISKHFSRHEFACRCGCGFDTVDYELVDILEKLSEYYHNPGVIINSGCRCVEHNKHEGGSKNSLHVRSKAADIVVIAIHADSIADYLEAEYPDKYGIGRYNGRTHIDVRAKRARWDKR